MAEYHPVVLGKSMSYAGYFDFAELWRLVRDYMESRGYKYLESEHNEIVTDDGKDIYISLDLDREVSQYVKLRIVLKAKVQGLNDVQIQKDKQTLFVQDGKINLNFEAFVMSDHEGRYDQSGMRFFLRTIMEKFVYDSQLKKFKSMATADLSGLTHEIKAYLNLFTY